MSFIVHIFLTSKHIDSVFCIPEGKGIKLGMISILLNITMLNISILLILKCAVQEEWTNYQKKEKRNLLELDH